MNLGWGLIGLLLAFIYFNLAILVIIIGYEIYKYYKGEIYHRIGNK